MACNSAEELKHSFHALDIITMSKPSSFMHMFIIFYKYMQASNVLQIQRQILNCLPSQLLPCLLQRREERSQTEKEDKK